MQQSEETEIEIIPDNPIRQNKQNPLPLTLHESTESLKKKTRRTSEQIDTESSFNYIYTTATPAGRTSA